MLPLDPLSFPLTGLRLIEASAGTGKTYTIANLYLRLILERGLDVTRVLVVTFTKAATEELRDRIRKRLREGLERLEQGSGRGDELDALLARGGDEAAGRLRDALIRMDEAAVFTIHGFCQRMLQENAFESGTLFDVEFIADELEMKRTIAADFWRIRFHRADEGEARWARGEWGTPAGLFGTLRPLLGREQVTLLPTVTAAQLDEAQAARGAALTTVLREWAGSGKVVAELLLTHKGLSRAATTYRNDVVEGALEGLAGFLEGGEGALPAGFELFTRHRLEDPKSLKKRAEAPEHPFFDACEALWQADRRHADLRRARLLAEALDYVRDQLQVRKEQQRVLAYDDLLSRLDFALLGEGGETLAARVAGLFPAAMIDEFQDTDPLQYRIFRRIYGERPDCGLFMIGDPKQAIYGFRGADIFTYIAARRDADPDQGCFTLGTNWRSASPLVDAVNTLFQSVEAPFLYRDEIDFHPVAAAGRADERPLILDGEVPPPLTAWLPRRDDDKPLPKNRARVLFAEAVAAEVARMLQLAEAGRAELEGRTLRAGDLAVLVRDRFEAAEVRGRLAAVGVGSVYISRDSVFQTAEAGELLRLMGAVAEPANGRALRAALVTTLLGVDGRQLEAMGREEGGAWEAWLEAFHRYHRQWRDHGFMAMFQTLLHERGVAHRLLALEEGERRLTNLLQLAELAQLEAAERFGMVGLIHWLVASIDQPDGDAEEQQLRLESDERLVQVVTIHKSKGLEYPVVFLPGLWNGRPLSDEGQLLLFHEERERSLCADLGSERRDAHLALAQRERLAEELRLLYVALTRAKYRCCFGWGAVKGAEATALAWLLHGGEEGMGGLDDGALEGALQRFAPHIEVVAPPQRGAGVAVAGRSLAGGRARPFGGRAEDRWLVTSYSGLVAGIEHGDTLRHERPDHDAVEPVAEAATGLRRDRFNFPRGSRAGLFLHTLLEQLDFTDRRDEPWSRDIERQLERHGFEVEWRPAVEELLGGVLDAPLAEGVALGQVGRSDRRDELAFHFPLAPIEAIGLNRLLDRFPGYFSGERALTFSPLEGVMKGFIDLVFRVGDRYYLADYKSNHLGDALGDYGPDALAAAMAEHRYDLQYLIYTVALHRHLRRSLPGYDYRRHFGGVFYLFLRGLTPRLPGNGVWFDHPDPALIDALDRYFAGDRP
ncbi:exodeoxyribonuclease V subunit beta [Endothiovibrio diazotrophicus]